MFRHIHILILVQVKVPSVDNGYITVKNIIESDGTHEVRAILPLHSTYHTYITPSSVAYCLQSPE